MNRIVLNLVVALVVQFGASRFASADVSEADAAMAEFYKSGRGLAFQCNAGKTHPSDGNRFYSWGFGYDKGVAECVYKPNPDTYVGSTTFYMKMEGFGPTAHFINSMLFFKCNVNSLESLMSRPFYGAKALVSVATGPVLAIFARSQFEFCVMGGISFPLGAGISADYIQFSPVYSK